MSHRILSYVVVLLTFAAAAPAQEKKETKGTQPDCEVKWTTMHAGIEYRTIRCLGETDGLDVHVVRVNPRVWQLDTAVAGGSGTNARSIAREKDAPFAINANFFDRARKAEGAVIRSGKVVQPPRNASWQSIFLVTERGRPYIVLPSEWKTRRDEAWMAVQAGPRLVVRGEKVNLKPNYSAPRAGVCIQWDRDLLFFATPANRKFHVTEIARVAVRKEEVGGLACRDAMLFDGGHSVNLHVEGDGDTVSINQDPVPVFVYATKK